jgi:hypothetical protein
MIELREMLRRTELIDACRPSRMVRLWPAAVLLVVSAHATAAERDLGAARLVWRSAPSLHECPGADYVKASLRARLGRDPLDDGAAGSIRITIDQVRGKYVAEIATIDAASAASDERRLTSGKCEELVDAVVLVLALQFGSDAPDARASSSAPPSSSAPRRLKEPAESVAPPIRTTSDAAWLGFGAIGAIGEVPQITPGALFTGGVGLGGGWELEGGMSYLATQRAAGATARFAFSATQARVGFGRIWSPSEGARITVSAGPIAGWLHAFPESPIPLHPGDCFYAGLRVGIQGGYRVIGPVGLAVGLGGHFLFNPWQFRVREEQDPVWVQPRLGLRGELLVTWDSR